MKALLVYFSGTGMTRFYASLIQEGFICRELRCDCRSIEEIIDMPALWQAKPLALNYTIHAETKKPLHDDLALRPGASITEALQAKREVPELAGLMSDWASYDLFGFGSPVYEFRPAAVMIRFLLDLPDFGGEKQAFSFATHDGAQGDYASFMEQLLTDKGFIYRGHLDHSFIYSAAFVLRRRYNAARSGRTLARKRDQAGRKINRFLDRLFQSGSGGISPQTKVAKRGCPSRLAALPWRFLFTAGMDYLLNTAFFGFGLEQDGCIQCYTCIKQCPQGLIEKDDRGYPLRKQHCMYCLRCINWCPTGALYFSVLTRGKARFPGPEALLDTARDHHPERWVRKG